MALFLFEVLSFDVDALSLHLGSLSMWMLSLDIGAFFLWILSLYIGALSPWRILSVEALSLYGDLSLLSPAATLGALVTLFHYIGALSLLLLLMH